MKHRDEESAAELPAVCKACDVRHGGICQTMSTLQLRELNRHAKRKVLEPGAEVHGQGEPIVSYANILKGVVKLTKVMADGRQQIVGLQFAPDFIGHPFSQESPYAVEAATGSEICAVPKSMLDRILGSTPGFERHLHYRAQAELDEAREWMLALGRKTAREKVASFLYRLATRFDSSENDWHRLELPLTRREIGDFLGLTIETVSRQITKLRQEKLIEVDGIRHFTVLDIRRLQMAAGLVE